MQVPGVPRNRGDEESSDDSSCTATFGSKRKKNDNISYPAKLKKVQEGKKRLRSGERFVRIGTSTEQPGRAAGELVGLSSKGCTGC